MITGSFRPTCGAEVQEHFYSDRFDYLCKFHRHLFIVDVCVNLGMYTVWGVFHLTDEEEKGKLV